MVTETETRVIDPEFTFYGPMGFDIGAVIANLLGYFASAGHERLLGERRGFEAWMLQTIENVWQEFARKFLELWRTEAKGDAYPAALFAGEAGGARLETERLDYMNRLFGDTSDLPRPRSSAASWVSRTTSISSGSRTRSCARCARRRACGVRGRCWSTHRLSPPSAPSPRRRAISATGSRSFSAQSTAFARSRCA
jgi:hypothetical protein